MSGRLKQLVIVIAVLAIGSVAASGQDVGAVSSGNWETGSIWTTGTVPGASNNVYIGSTYPSGSAAIATVTLTQNESANNMYLSQYTNTSGTLNIGNNTLTIAGVLELNSGGTATVQEGPRGSFTAGGASVNLNSLNFGVNDAVGTLYINNATVTTAAVGNVTGDIYFVSGTLNLGANMNITTAYSAEAAAILNMNGYAINAQSLDFGYDFSVAPTIENRGAFTVGGLEVGNSAFNLDAADNVHAFALNNATSTLYSSVAELTMENGSTVTTTANGSVTYDVIMDTGSTLNFGDNLNLAGGMYNQYVTIADGSTVDANHFGITSTGINLGWTGSSAASLINTGLVQTDFLNIGNGSSLTLHGGDVIYSGISLADNSVLTVQQTNGIGLTFAGTSAGSLSIDPSQIDLIFSNYGWDFRWQESVGRRQLDQHARRHDQLRGDCDHRTSRLFRLRPERLHVHRFRARAVVARLGLHRERGRRGCSEVATAHEHLK